MPAEPRKAVAAGPGLGRDAWVGAVGPEPEARFDTLRAVEKPAGANEVPIATVAAADAEVDRYLAAEEKAYAALSPEAQGAYRALAEGLRDSPAARRALQKMLLDGRLPGGAPLEGGGTLLSQLGRLTEQDLAQGVDRGALLRDVVLEVEKPLRIDQRMKGTCAATTAQFKLAKGEPAEYVRLVAGLAAPAGEATMAGGHVLTRDARWKDGSDVLNGAGRSLPSRLIQPALMDEGARVEGGDYDNMTDETTVRGGKAHRGMQMEGAALANSQLLDRRFVVRSVNGDRDAAWEAVKGALRQGSVSVSLKDMYNKNESHMVQVERVEDGRVVFANPHGLRQSMSEPEFKAAFQSAVLPA